MNWLIKLSQHTKTHPDPWEMTMAEINAYVEPEFPVGTLYHGTGLGFNQVDQILNRGILLSSALGNTYGEPNWIWSSLDKDEAYDRRQCVIAFRADLNDPDVKQVNQSWVRLSRDVPPADILYAIKSYLIRIHGVRFEGRLEEFKDNEIWHKLSIGWALKNNLNVPEHVLHEYEDLDKYK